MLKELVNINAVSGRETPMSDFIVKELSGVAEVTRDAVGNIIAHIKGDGKKLLLASHMDEIGIMVTFIEDTGFLRFTGVGGVSALSLNYSKVIFPSGRTGIISAPKKSGSDKIEIADMFIDIGASSKEEALKFVKIGDMAGLKSEYYETENNVSSGKLDDRIGCALLLEIAKKVKNPVCDLYLGFTVQEEVGLRGAAPITNKVEPYMSIAVDVTATGDTPSAEPMAVSLGDGVAIKIKDGRMVASEKVVNLLEDICKKNNIKYQFEVLKGGTTDASIMQITAGGNFGGAISIPTRYIHSTCETASLSDIKEAEKLIEKLVLSEELK